MKWVKLIGLERNVMELSDYPPGFSTHRYRLTPEEIERKKRWLKIQAEKEERHRRQLIEEGKLRPDDEPDAKTE
jgi:hypothetical protein